MKLSLFTLASFPLVMDRRPFVAPFAVTQKTRGTPTTPASTSGPLVSLLDDEEEDLPTTLHVRALAHA